VDWLKIRNLLGGSPLAFIKQVESDARCLRLLHKGAILRSSLDNLWRDSENYLGAPEAVKDALLQEHFSLSTKVQKGIHVMTIHKAKGKEFDEVIIYEGPYQGRIVHNDADKKEIDRARLNLRVAVTRARLHTTILTSSSDVCCLL
jgi:DNA helicase-2/ATP-dependent DNA helicase PcrA